MKSAINYLPVPEIEKLINDIETSDLSTADIDDLNKKVWRLTTGLKIIAPQFHPGLKLYRGRRFEVGKEPKLISELSYCPESYCKTMGRANRIGKSLFYAAAHINPLFFELDAQPGDIIGIAHWTTKDYLLATNIGYSQRVFNESTRECPKWGELGISPEDVEVNELLHDFFSRSFMGKIPVGEEYRYKISIAIAECWIKNDPMNALLYPSAAMRCNGDNFAIKPSFVDASMTPVRAELARVKSAGTFEFDIDWIDSATEFDADGTIKWKGRFDQWELSEAGQRLNFRVNQLGRWEAFDEHGNLVDPK